MKRSEARILIFLSNADDRHKYAKYMAIKLRMDYGYLLKILNGLKFYKIIIPHKRDNKVFYSINPNKREQLIKARIRLGKE